MNELDSLRTKLFDRTPLLGASRRKQAAETLALADDEVAIVLAEALIGVDDEVVHAIAVDRVARLADPAAIDAVCELWAKTRDSRLQALIQAQGWIAREPYWVRALSLLAAGGGAALYDAMPELVPDMVELTEDQDQAISDAAWDALANLNRRDAIETLCDLVLQDEDLRAVKAVRDGGYLPEDPQRRALLRLLTGQAEAAAGEDPEGKDLAEALRTAEPEARARIAELAREARYAPWARALMGRPTAEYQNVEWEALLLVLGEARDFAAIWRLVPFAPVVVSAAYMRYLKRVGYQPDVTADDAGLFHKLVNLVPRLSGDPHEFAFRIRELPIYEGKPGSATCLAVSADWRYLAIGGDDQFVRVYSLPDATLVATIDDLPGWTRALSFGAGGKYLAVATMKHQTRIYRLPDGLPVGYFDTRDVNAVALRQDGRLLATCSGQRVDLWDVEGGNVMVCLPAHGRLVKGMTIGQRGHTLATWGADGATRVWSLPEGRPLGTVEGDESGVTAVALAPDESRLAIAHGDHYVRVFSLPDGELLAELPGDGQPVRTMAFRPDGEVLAVAGHNHRIRLFTIPNGDPLGVVEGYAGAHALAWNSMGQLLAVAGEGKRSVKIWCPAAPALTEDTVQTARPEEIAWAQRLHKDPTLTTEERAWLTFWGTLVLAVRGSLPTAPRPDRPQAPPDEAPHPWEGGGVGAA